MAIITNADGKDVLVGTNEADLLDSTFSQIFDNYLYGGAGNDTYLVDSTDDDIVIEEAGGGTDTVRSWATYGLTPFVENLVLLGGGNTWGQGNDLDNSLTGNSGNNILVGGLGKDVMAGGLGNDTYFVDNALDVVTEGLDAGIDMVDATATWVMSANVENLTLFGFAAINGTGNTLDNVIDGGGGNNIIDGGAGNDKLGGGEGNDTLIGGAGNDRLEGGDGVDTMTGGAGDDYYVTDGNDKPVVEAAGGGNDTVEAHGGWSLETNVENLILATGIAGPGNHLLGNALNNYIQGNENDNSISAGAGDDTLDGRGGFDAMAGGTGNDTYVVDDSGDKVTEQAGEGTADKIITSVFYQLPDNVENIQLAGSSNISAYGNALNNVMTGNSGNNFLLAFGGNDTIDGRGGADNMQGGAGNDTYYFDNVGDFAQEFKDSGTDTVFTSVSYDFGGSFYIENMTLTGIGDLSLTANNQNNIIIGNSGANSIDGKGGFDTMTGGLGNDTYFVGNFVAGNASLSDRVIEAVNAGYDSVYAFVASYVLPANVERLVLGNTLGTGNGTGNLLDNILEGNAGDNVLDGGAGNDSLFAFGGNDTLIGGLGNDTLNGGVGNDTMTGGAGDDLYIVSAAGDTVIEFAAGGTDRVQSSVSFDLSVASVAGGANVENLTLIGSGNINGTGNALNNIIVGNDGNNILSGGAGNDVLDGGEGADAMTGGAGNDTYVVDLFDFNNPGNPSLNDTVVEGPSGGTDTVQVWVSRGTYDFPTGTDALFALEGEVENLVMLGSDDLEAKGNGLANTMTGNSGNNVLSGGAGADKLIGGKGDDTYFIDQAGDVITELAGAGMDRVFLQYVPVGSTYTLGPTLEILRLSLVSGAVNGTGNALDNGIEGNAQSNTLNGLGGNDLLFGGGGNDVLNGGDGNDHLESNGGLSTFNGGAGNDFYMIRSVSNVTHNPYATIVDLAGQGTDSVQTSVDFDMTANGAANIENLYLDDAGFYFIDPGYLETTFNIHAIGNSLDNNIFGNLSNNIVEGGGGNDSFYFQSYDIDFSTWSVITGDGPTQTYFGATLDSNDAVYGGTVNPGGTEVDTGTADKLFAAVTLKDALAPPTPLHVHGVEDITLYSGKNTLSGANVIDMTDVHGAQTVTISDMRFEDYGYDGNGDPVSSIADVSMTGLAAGIEVIASRFSGNLELYLANSGGTADEQLVTLNGFNGGVTTAGIETVTLNIEQLPDGSATTANMINATNVNEVVLSGRSGVLNLTLPNGTDQMSFENMNLEVHYDGAGLTSLAIGLDNAGATLIPLNAITLTSLDLDTTGSAGASFLDVSESGAALVTVTGNQALSMTVAQNLNATNMTGDLFAGAWGLNFGVSLKGGLGSDTLNGGEGNDLLGGGAGGTDVLWGNGGDDTFVFDSPLSADHNVYMPGFVSGSDTIELRSAIFTSLGTPGTLGVADFYKGDVSGISGQHIAFDGNTGNLYYDADGVAGNSQLVANVWNGNNVENTDITIV